MDKARLVHRLGRLDPKTGAKALSVDIQRFAPEWYSKAAAHVCGRPRVFVLAVGVIAAWIVTGPIFAFSDTWQLVINTGTTIVTFLMVFLIQNTQYRDTEAIQVKLDELIRATTRGFPRPSCLDTPRVSA